MIKEDTIKILGWSVKYDVSVFCYWQCKLKDQAKINYNVKNALNLEGSHQCFQLQSNNKDLYQTYKTWWYEHKEQAKMN